MTPLEGIKVLDLTRLLPGPLASLVLADLGARVDKIEDTGGGDYLRGLPPLSSGDEPTSTAFLALNRNKRSAVVDLKTPAGRDAFLRLVEHYDVLFEQFRPGVLDRLGLGHADLRRQNPRLIVCALTGYGQTGPLARRAGHDIDYLARSGVLGFQGPPGGPPAVPGFQLADVSGGLYSVIGIMGALMERARSGEGAVVDVAMVETAMPFAAAGFGALFGGAPPPAGGGVITGGIAPYATYATKDGKAVALGALEPKFWAAFCEGIGRKPTLDDLVPGAHQDALREELAEEFRRRTRDEWAAFASVRDCCLEPVLTPAEARDDAHLAARRMFFELDSPWGKIGQLRTPLASPLREHLPPPRRGEHTDDVFGEAGFRREEIAALRAAGAIR